MEIKIKVYGTPAEIAEFVTRCQSNSFQKIQESVQVKSEEQSEVQVNHIKVNNYWDKLDTLFTGSVIDNQCNIAYYVNGQYHRKDGPAIECVNGHKEWYLHGREHRENGPAIEYADGTKCWYLHGKYHRKDGPAIEYANGTKCWYFHDKRHREDGPAREFANGTKEWYLHGEHHREDGPAVEYADGTKEWWYNGELISKDSDYTLEAFQKAILKLQ